MTAAEREMLRDGAGELGVVLDEAAVGRFDLFASELLRWNAKVNLTAIRSTHEIIVKHFLDSLTLSRILNQGSSLLDIGSGGGFPAIPLKIARPDLAVVSVDSVQKKILFQRHAGRLLGLERFTAVHGRAEGLPAVIAERFDCVVARAVSDLATLARLGLPMLAEGGRVIAMKGRQGREEITASRESLSLNRAAVFSIDEVRLPVSGEMRLLIALCPEKSST